MAADAVLASPAGEHTALAPSKPTEGQNAMPPHKTYKFGILGMMSCLRMISWAKDRNVTLQRTCTALMFTLLKMKVLARHGLRCFKGKFYN